MQQEGHNRQKDWAINNQVRMAFVRRLVDTDKIEISTTKGIVDIKGRLFYGGCDSRHEDETTIVRLLKTLETAARAIPDVRDVRWNLDGWEKVGLRWVPKL